MTAPSAPTPAQTDARRALLRAGNLQTLFNEIGWDNSTLSAYTTSVDGLTYTLRAVAQKRNVQILECRTPGAIPAAKVRRAIEAEARKIAAEHLLIFVNAERTEQIWQWMQRKQNKPPVPRVIPYHTAQSGDAVLQSLVGLTFTLAEEDGLTLLGILERMSDTLGKEQVTKAFYKDFETRHTAFVGFLEGISDEGDKRWYASVLLNRIMFLYFLQSKLFLNGEPRYLQTRLADYPGDTYYNFSFR